MSRPTANPSARAFTLVELLVVIGVIALLVALLLPSLAKARQQAQATACASNMRQIAAAILCYANDNHGVLPPCTVCIDRTNTIYPNGWFWATELVAQHYLDAPRIQYDPAGNPILANARSSLFWCPACSGETDMLQFPVSETGVSATSFSTDALNTRYASLTNPSSGNIGNVDTSWGNWGVATWYMPFSALDEITAALGTSAGAEPPPFIWFYPSSTPVDQYLRDPHYRRKLSNIRRAAQAPLLVESNSENNRFTGSPNALLPRIAARHGQRTSDNRDAYTNIAFFDGHVALLPTHPFSQRGFTGFGPGDDVIFLLNRQ